MLSVILPSQFLFMKGTNRRLWRTLMKEQSGPVIVFLWLLPITEVPCCNLYPFFTSIVMTRQRLIHLLLFSIVLVDKVQHSLWVAESFNSCLGEHPFSSSQVSYTEVSPCQFSFRRIWQAKGYQTAATKVPFCLCICSLPFYISHLQEPDFTIDTHFCWLVIHYSHHCSYTIFPNSNYCKALRINVFIYHISKFQLWKVLRINVLMIFFSSSSLIIYDPILAWRKCYLSPVSHVLSVDILSKIACTFFAFIWNSLLKVIFHVYGSCW